MNTNTLTASIEKLPLTIYDDKQKGSAFVANEIASIIRANNEEKKKTVIGLATGSSPLLVYQELIRKHKDEGLSFKNVRSFNLDEYYPIKPDNKQSYHHFMYEHFFNHIDIDPQNVFIPDGSIYQGDIREFCMDYEQKIESSGGIDVQLLGHWQVWSYRV